MSYTELHLHTSYSFLEGASHPDEYVSTATKFGYNTLAVTDRNGVYGAMEFARACLAANIRPITGTALTLRHGIVDEESGPVTLILLAESRRGYNTLCRLVTEAHRSSPRGNVALDPSFLEGHTEGLIVLSGGRAAEITRLVDARRFEEAAEAGRRLKACFGADNTFVELHHNLVQGDTRRVELLVRLAAHLNLRTVATGDVYYHERARHRLQDAMVAIRHRTTLEASHPLRHANSEHFLRTPAEAAARFAAYPEAIESTALISERCKGFILADQETLGYEFPDFMRKTDEGGSPADEVLARYCWARLAERYPLETTDPVQMNTARAQLAEELRLVAKHHLAGFFLIYRDLQELATEVARDVRGAGSIRESSGLPPGRGRGSSVSSIICYLIGLSHVDPVANRLFYRRFLNDALQTVPDIDLDFAREIREELILRVIERYGRDHAALVCTFATYHLRSAVRDLGKVLGLPPSTVDKLAKLSEGGKASSIRAEIDRLPALQGQTDGPLWAHLMELAAELDGMPRHISQHVGGMIISSSPLIECVPVQPTAMEGRFICQWDKDSCDDARFIKIDFLALGMLSLVEECLELIWESQGQKVDLSSIRYDEPAIYRSIREGDTVGLFQIESRAQIQMLPRTQPENLDDLAVQVAIVRPGPIVGGAVNPYVKRREQKRANPNYKPPADDPLLDEVLSDTLGIILYQDQVLEVAMKLGGFTAGQADQFRRAMSRRRSRDRMGEFEADFIKGAVAQGVERDTAKMIFEKLLGFSAFGFPKSHAYAFAVLAYQSAWLREYYPAEYFAALFNNQPMGFYGVHVLVGDAKRRGIQILRVAINASRVRSFARSDQEHGGQVLLGLTSVRGVSTEVARLIVAERDANGPYQSLADLLRRTELPRLAVENLISVGALADIGMNRRELLWQLGLLVPQGQGVGRKGRQLSLPMPVSQDMVSLKDMTSWERMVADYGILRLSPSFHPFGLMRKRLSRDLLTAAALKMVPNGTTVRTAGMVVCRQRPETAKGYIFLLLEDETGLTNVIVKPDLYEAERSVVRGEMYVCVEGLLRFDAVTDHADRVLPDMYRPVKNGERPRYGTLNLIATSISRLTDAPGALLPRPRLRHPYPGNPHDPREAAAREGAREGAQEAASPIRSLDLATPRSHDFH